MPKEKYWLSFQQGVKEFQEHPTLHDTNGIKCGLKFTNFADFNLNTENSRLGIALKEGLIASTSLWLIEDDKFIGAFDVRHSLTEELLKKGGNIACYIIPSKRKKGYATRDLKLCCKYAKEVLNLNKVLVTCNASNTGSYKTMLKVMKELGGQEDTPITLDDKEEKRVWISTKDLL